jgi:hypothetical protein
MDSLAMHTGLSYNSIYRIIDRIIEQAFEVSLVHCLRSEPDAMVCPLDFVTGWTLKATILQGVVLQSED